MKGYAPKVRPDAKDGEVHMSATGKTMGRRFAAAVVAILAVLAMFAGTSVATSAPSDGTVLYRGRCATTNWTLTDRGVLFIVASDEVNSGVLEESPFAAGETCDLEDAETLSRLAGAYGWLAYAEDVRELRIAEGVRTQKSLKGAFGHMRDVASKKHREKNASYLSHREEKEATLSYFGVKDPAALLEDGLMYAFYQNCASRWAPPEGKVAEIREAQEAQKKEDGLKLDFNELFG